MSQDDRSRIRNFGIVAHIDAGKTTVTERVLYFTKRIHRIGSVDEGTATTDFLEEEQARGISITSAATTCPWRDSFLNLIDTPGHVDFTAEVERSLRVLDGVAVVFCGVGGVEAQSETVWRQADRYQVPRLAFVNKLDRVGSDFFSIVEEIRRKLHERPVPLQIPIGAAGDFEGVVDLVTQEALRFDEAGGIGRGPLPPDLAEQAAPYRETLLEAAAEASDDLLRKYVEAGDLSPAEIRRGLRRATIACRIVPVLCGSALRSKGIQPLLDAVVDYLPSPDEAARTTAHDGEGREVEVPPDPKAPVLALAFKIVGDAYGDLAFVRVYAGSLRASTRVLNVNKKKKELVTGIFRMHANHREPVPALGPGEIGAVTGFKVTGTGDTLAAAERPFLLERMRFPDTVISVAVEPKRLADRDRLLEVLARLAREDPTFEWRSDEETGQVVMSGMGELHLEILRNRLVRDHKVAVNAGRPRVSYRETIRQAVEAEASFEREIGGRNHFASVRVRLEPAPEAAGAVFEDHSKPEEIPRAFGNAVREGVLSAARSGPLAGYPVVQLRAILLGGRYRLNESSDVSFQAAASLAFRSAVERGRPALLEPTMRFEVTAADAHLGDILNDLKARRASIEAMERKGAQTHLIRGLVPLAGMFGYATALRSLSQGRSVFSMEPCAYTKVPEEKYTGLGI